MSKKIKSFNVEEPNDGTENFELPDESAENDRAFEELTLNNAIVHYNFVNLFVLSVLILFSFVFFIAVSGSSSVDDNLMTLTFKNFMSGHYVQSLEDKYNNEIPYPETMKALEQRFSLFYGIGNKVTDPLFVDREAANNGRNVFDEMGNGLPQSNGDENRKENVITTKATDENGQTVTTTKKKETNKESTTSAVARKDATAASSTTAGNSTTTNNDPPQVTITHTEPYHPATTTPPTETEAPPVTSEPATEPTTGPSSESEPPEE